MCTAIIAHYLGPRLGIGQYLERLLPPLVEQLHTAKVPFKIIASPNALSQTPALQTMKGEVEILDALDYPPGKRYLWFLTKFAQFCRKSAITSVIWLSNPIVLPWHPSSIAVLHDVNEWKAKEKYGSYAKTALRSLIYLDSSLYCARKIILVSQATYADLIAHRKNPKLLDKLTVIPNGSDSQLVQLPSVPIALTGNPYLLSVGRIDPTSKRLPEAVELVAELRTLSDTPWELHLVGGMNATSEQAGQSFLQSIKNLPWVHYHGYVNDQELAERYRQAKAVIFLADSEGFGLPVAEAASFGLWAIVNQRNKACIEAGGDALVAVDPSDTKAYAKLVSAKLGQKAPPKKETSTWQDASVGYAIEIKKLVNG